MGLVRVAEASRPESPVKPAAGHTEKVPTDASSR